MTTAVQDSNAAAAVAAATAAGVNWPVLIDRGIPQTPTLKAYTAAAAAGERWRTEAAIDKSGDGCPMSSENSYYLGRAAHASTNQRISSTGSFTRNQ